MPELEVALQVDLPKVSLVRRAKPQLPTTADPSTWYLGGNHSVKLLFSVEGDFDPKILSKVTAVPSIVGELALSVESLVSHDLTVGGFEKDLLAKITSNTLAGKRASDDTHPTKKQKKDESLTISIKSPVTITAPVSVSPQRSPSMESFAVPNPLLGSSYEPVPNPLAAPVTPPDSPVSVSSQNFRKRKASSILPNFSQAKVNSRFKVPTTVVTGIKAAAQ